MKNIMETFNPYEMIENNAYMECSDKKNEDLVNEIYISLCAIFKGSWVSNHQEDINAYKKQLFLAFQQFGINTQEQIEKGLFNARTENLQYFPSIKQVVDWCLMKKQSKPEYHQDYKKLTNTCTTKEVAVKHLGDILKAIR